MIELQGRYTKAILMTDYTDEETISQVYSFINQAIFKDCQIVIMPDCHKGAGAVIGFTMPLKNFVIPNIIGVDIGCGIESYNIGHKEIDFLDFDLFLRNNIPSGFNIRDKEPNIYYDYSNLKRKINSTIKRLESDFDKKYSTEYDRVINSLGTLGGGNHFIEIDSDKNGDKWLTIHTGSRNFGKQIAEFYQKKAKKYIDNHKIKGIQSGLEYLYIDDEDGQNYIEDMKTAQEFASLNRRIIATILLSFFLNDKKTDKIERDFENIKSVKSIHNYINFSDNIVRKGAISAHNGENVIIPLNMKDGVIIATGKGISGWNNSAPHGAGRILSRSGAKREINLEDYEKIMSGVWSSCINSSTIDESPMAYKSKDEIIENIKDTVEIINILQPIYNFKASD